MTFRFNAKHLALCLSFSALFSCKKDDTTAPTPPADNSLFTQLQGRWNAEIEEPSGSAGSGSASGKQQESDEPGEPEGRVAAVEFSSDSTFILAFDHGMAFTGKFNPTDESTIKCATTVGEVVISDVKIVDNSISFTIPATIATPTSVSVKATKAENLTITEDKKALLQKDWMIEKDLADGALFYASATQFGNDTKAYFRFTAAGSLLFKFRLGQGSQIPSMPEMPSEMIMFQNWKWEAGNSSTIVAAPIFGEGMSTSTMEIISLTSTTLKLKQNYPQSGTQNPDGPTSPYESLTIVLTAQ